MGYSLLRGNIYQGDSPSKENEQKIQREIAILKRCHHPNIIQLKEVIDDPNSRKIYMALEYTEYGEIEWRDQDDHPIISIEETRRYFRDIVCGLDYLHYQGIIHRDIKPANLLLDHHHVVKISDFGVSYYNELLAEDNTNINTEDMNRIDKELAETAGTPAFFAPELCCSDNQHLRISKAIDVWALGVTLYCLVFGRCPFIASTEFELFDTIPIQPLLFPEDITIEDSLKHLLNRLLTKNPEERITLEEVKLHPWVTADLNNPSVWIEQSDPRLYVHRPPLSLLDRIKRSIQRLSISFSRRKKQPVQEKRLNMNRHSQPDMSKRYSYISTISNYHSNIPRPLSSYHSDISSTEEYHRNSYASSSSGGLTFGQHMTPIN